MPDRTEQFLELYNREQRHIYAHIRTLLLRSEDAEEVFQEVCIAMWQSFEKFEVGTNFSAWARKIATHRVLAFCKKRRRDPLMLSPEAMAAVSAESEQLGESAAARRTALSSCLERLNGSDREIIACRFQGQTTLAEVAERLGRPLNTIYKAMQRIRRTLTTCVERKLASEGWK